MGRSSREVRVASALKDAKVLVGGRGVEKSKVGCGSTDHFGG